MKGRNASSTALTAWPDPSSPSTLCGPRSASERPSRGRCESRRLQRDTTTTHPRAAATGYGPSKAPQSALRETGALQRQDTWHWLVFACLTGHRLVASIIRSPSARVSGLARNPLDPALSRCGRDTWAGVE